MKKLLFALLLCFCNGIFAATTLDIICHSNIKPLTETDRSINFTSTNYKKDLGISKGWYTFGKNKQIPSICPKVGQCSAAAPLWTASPNTPYRESPGPTNITLCASYSSSGSGASCFEDDEDFCFNIEAAYCANVDLHVYNLRPFDDSNMRYCYAESVPCPASESSTTGFQPGCQKTFSFDKLVNGTTTHTTGLVDPYLSTQIPGVSLKCSLPCPTGAGDCSKLDGDVYWYRSSTVELFKTTELRYDPKTMELFGYLKEADWGKKEYMNDLFYCEIVPRFNKVYKPYRHLFTEPFYVGLILKVTDTKNQVHTYRYGIDKNEIRIQLEEANQNSANLEVYTNIPILCNEKILDGANECSLPISMAKEGRSDKVRVASCNPACEGCKRELSNQTYPDSSITAFWKIYPTVSNDNKNSADTVKISLVVRSNPKVLGSYWKNLLLPTIFVDYIPQNLPTTVGRSLNDPHLRTHDGTFLEFHNLGGEYLVMENKKTLLRIHSTSVDCRQYYTTGFIEGKWCNDKLYIQSMDDVVFHDITQKQFVFYADSIIRNQPVKLTFDIKTGRAIIPNKSNGIRVFDESGYFKVVTHFGTIIKIDKNYGNYYIYPAKVDKGDFTVRGILGDYNGFSGDDLNNPSGTGNLTDSQFFAQFKIKQPLMSLRQYYPLSSNELNEAEDLTEYCICANDLTELETKDNGDFNCSLGLLDNGGNTVILIPQSLKKRITLADLEELTAKSDILESIRLEKSIGLTDKPVLKRQARSTCDTALSASEFKECKGLVEFDQLLKSCESDFSSTGIDIWTEGYVRYARDTCKTKLSNDISNFVSTSKGMMPRSDILRELCPNKCNNNGVCNDDAKCECNAPFDGYDCSIDTSQPALIYASSSPNGICDSSKSNCFDVLLLVDRISSTMMMEYEAFVQMEDGSMKSIDRGASSILKMSDNIVFGNLEKPSTLPSGSDLYYNISVKDMTISNSITYRVTNIN